MALCDKWVALKIVEVLACVACLVGKRVSQDDEARLSLLLQKFSREWSLLTSITWDSVGGAFADAIYGGYVIITFGLLLGRIFQEVPRGRRILESFFLGMGLLFFLILGGLELASLDSVPRNLVVNASVLGSLSLVVAALFLLDLMGPRTYFASTHSQTDVATVAGILSSPKSDKKVSISTPAFTGIDVTDEKHKSSAPLNGRTDALANGTKTTVNGRPAGNGLSPSDKKVGNKVEMRSPDRPKDLDLEKGNIAKKEESSLFDEPKHGYSKFGDDILEDELERSKFGSLRNEIEGGNYIRLSDPLSELHYEQELAKFNDWYYKQYLESPEGKFFVKEKYLPELQSPVFAKVKTGRLKGLYDDLSPSYEEKIRQKSPSRAKLIPTPTLQQLEDYLKHSNSNNRTKRGDTPLFPMEPIEEKDKDLLDGDGRASGTPTDRGYVQYAAEKWPDKKNLRTPRHSPT